MTEYWDPPIERVPVDELRKTQNDITEWTVSLARALTSIGIGRRDVVQVGYSYGLFTSGLGLHYGAEMVGASAIPTSSGNTERQIELMQDLGSTAMVCTPSYFLYVNEVANKLGISIKNDTKLTYGIFGACRARYNSTFDG